MAHRIWKGTKQLPCMLPGPAVPGCSLVSLHFLWAILCPKAVLSHFSTCESVNTLKPLLSYVYVCGLVRSGSYSTGCPVPLTTPSGWKEMLKMHLIPKFHYTILIRSEDIVARTESAKRVFPRFCESSAEMFCCSVCVCVCVCVC